MVEWKQPIVLATSAVIAVFVVVIAVLFGVYWSDITDASCWSELVPDCTWPHRIECNRNEWFQRMLLVCTNVLYLFAPCVLYYQRRIHHDEWDDPDVAFTVVNIILCCMSSLHHLCDTSSRSLYCTTRCINTFSQTYWSDATAASMTPHVAVMLGWPLNTRTERIYFLVSLLVYPFISLNLVNDADDHYAFLLYTVAFVCVDVGMRLRFQGWQTLKAMVVQQWFWVVVALVCALIAVFEQYGSSFMWPSIYIVPHALWHIGTAIADMCAPVIFSRIHTSEQQVSETPVTKQKKRGKTQIHTYRLVSPSEHENEWNI